MGDDDNNTPPAGDGSGDGGTPTPKPPAQDELSRVAAAEAARGKRSGAKEALEKLGFSSEAEALEFVKSVRDRESDELTEAQKILRRAEEKERKAEEATRLAQETSLNAKVERALEAAGVPVASSPKVRRLVEGLDFESTDEEISAAVGLLKAEMPNVFSATPPAADDGKPETPPPPPNSDVGKPPANQTPPSDTATEAKNLLHARHPQLTQQ